jgi:branched-chain amino acid transport system substrate-binding protein
VISLLRRGRVAAAGLVCALATVPALAGCSGGGDEGKVGAPPALDGEVTFGVLAPLSGAGDLAARGRDRADGAQLAADEANAHGGVLGRKVALVSLDDACLPTVAYEAAKSLANTGVSGVVGGVCEDATAKEISVIDAAGVPFLVSVANGPDLVSEQTATTYLMNGTVYQQGMSAVHWMGYQSAQRLAVISDGTAGSEMLAKDAVRMLDNAPELVARRTVPEKTTDLAPTARAVLTAKPDFVLWTGSASGGGALVKALRAAGYKGTFTGTAASESQEFLDAAGPAAEGAYVTATPSPANIPIADKWSATFRKAYDRDPGFEALQAYDGIRALVQATRQAGSADPAKVAENVPQLGEDFTTFLGTLRFARDHLMIYDNRLVLVVKNGRFALERSLRTDI